MRRCSVRTLTPTRHLPTRRVVRVFCATAAVLVDEAIGVSTCRRRLVVRLASATLVSSAVLQVA